MPIILRTVKINPSQQVYICVNMLGIMIRLIQQTYNIYFFHHPERRPNIEGEREGWRIFMFCLKHAALLVGGTFTCARVLVSM
jgi:hypothetical protein